MAKELSISERLEWLLRTRGVSQNALARNADVSPQTVANTLRHGRLPQARTIERFAQTLGVPASVFTQQLLTENDLKGIVAKSGPYQLGTGASKGSGSSAAKGGILGLATPGATPVVRPAGMLGSTTPMRGRTTSAINKSTASRPAATTSTTAKKATVKKTTSSKTSAAKKPAAKKSITAKPAAKKATAKKTTAKKAVAKKPAAKKAVAKKPTTKAAAAKKPMAKKSVAKKPMVKKAVAKKPVAKKTTAKASTRKVVRHTAAKKAAPARKATTSRSNGASNGHVDVQQLITKLQKLGGAAKKAKPSDILKAVASLV